MTPEPENDDDTSADGTSADDTELMILDDDQRRSAQFLRDSALSEPDETDRDTTE